MKAHIVGFRLRSIALMSLVGLALWGCASTPKTSAANDPEIRALDADRAKFRASKRELINEAMMLDPSQRGAFWAEYDKYEADLKNYYDEKLLLIRDYARNYEHMNDDVATNLAERAFKLQQTRLDLIRKHFSAFSKATSPTVAARFLQLEHQINLLSDIRIGTEMPLMPMPRDEKLKAKR